MKDWSGNKTSTITTSGFHNNSVHDRDSNDFYATDPIALEKLLKYETFNNVWECACGDGNLSEVPDFDLLVGGSPCQDFS